MYWRRRVLRGMQSNDHTTVGVVVLATAEVDVGVDSDQARILAEEKGVVGPSVHDVRGAEHAIDTDTSHSEQDELKGVRQRRHAQEFVQDVDGDWELCRLLPHRELECQLEKELFGVEHAPSITALSDMF
jgi:hypothetical protein